MAIPAAGIGAGLAASALITEVGDVAEAAISGAVELLKTPIKIELGGDGYKLFGRRRSRKTKSGERRLYDDRTTIRSLELPLFVPLGALWLTGLWVPGKIMSEALGRLLGTPPGWTDGAPPTLEWQKAATEALKLNPLFGPLSFWMDFVRGKDAKPWWE